MAKILIILVSFCSFYSYSVGLIEATTTLAISAELAQQGAQNQAQLKNQAKQQAQNFEAREKERQRLLNEALGR